MGRGAILLLGLAACGRMGFAEDDLKPDAGEIVSTNTSKITIQQSGSGTIVGPNGFSCNNGECMLEVAKGATVTLRSLAATGAWFSGWTNVCGGTFDCTFAATEDETTIVADFTDRPNRAFVTSTSGAGDFGGIAAADAICAQRAAAAELDGTFIAYLSDTTTNAQSRIGTSRGWIRVDGAPYADAPSAFADGSIVFPPRLDEYGSDIGNVFVWTGTNAGATMALCGGWTSNLGTDNGGMSRTQYSRSSVVGTNRACTSDGHLMCLEVGRVVPVAVHPDTGKLAFATSATWTPGGGRASADALCASEASAAGLSGTFLAAVATTTETIASRFSPDAIYKRVDGVRLLRDTGFFDVDWLDVPPELDKYGGFVNADFWTGAVRFNATTTAAENCNDWTDSTATATGHMHFTTHTDVSSPAKTYPCDSAVPLLCLER